MTIAMGGRAWATSDRVTRDGTAVRKKREKGSVGGKKNRWTRRMESGVGRTGVRDREKFPGIRVLGFRRISSSTMENKYLITCYLFGDFFLGRYTHRTPFQRSALHQLRAALRP